MSSLIEKILQIKWQAHKFGCCYGPVANLKAIKITKQEAKDFFYNEWLPAMPHVSSNIVDWEDFIEAITVNSRISVAGVYLKIKG